ncbi:MAG: FtsX-like permease family protein [Tepidisphaera sp.]|nr:FtsX-like permease family protein [Tepidisphaera sp.]
MMRIAIKMLVGDRLKYLGLLAGMAFAAMMIAQQMSIFLGLSSQTGTFIREMTSADLWVMDPQVRFSEDNIALPDTALQRVRSVEGVDHAVPLYKGFLKAQLDDGTRTSVIVVGVDDATLQGAPAKINDGDAMLLRQDPGILIDDRDLGTKLAYKRAGGKAMKIGDRLSINDHDAVVVGTYHGSPAFFWDPIVYTTYSRALEFAPRERRLMSFVLVKVKAGEDVMEVKRRIEARTGYVARTPVDFENVTKAYILKSTGILVNFGIAVGLGFIIGMIVTGQTFFNFTLDNLRYFAALKAMGASTWMLIRMVIGQVLSVTWLAFGLGVGIAAMFGFFLAKTDLAFLMKWQVLALTIGMMLVVGVLAALISLVKVLRLEAGVVFKG